MDFTQQQQQYGAPPTSPAWQTTAPQKQASTMNMMGGGAPPAPSTNPFENNGGYGASTSPAPRMQQQQQPMQAQADSRAPEFDPSSPGTPGQRMPTSPMQQQQPQAQPNANDPFASVSPVSVAAASAPAPLMQGQPPNAAGLRQPSLGMNGANQGQQQAPNTTNPFEQPNQAPAPPTSPAPAPQAQPNANADPFASFGAVAAPTSPAPAPQAPAPAPMGAPPAPPAPPAEAPPAAPPAPPAAQPSFEGLSHANQVHGSESFASGGVPAAPSQDMSQQPQPPVQQNQYQPPPPQQQPPAAPAQQQPQQQQQAWNQPAQQQPAPNALVQATQPQQQQQAYSNYNLGTGYPASNEQPPQQQPPQQNQYQQSQQQLVAAPAADPFGVFNQQEQAPAPAPTQAPPQAPAQENNDDFWGAFANTASPATANTQDSAIASQQPSTPLTLGENGLPDGGEFYKARVSVPMLGVLFFKGVDLAKSIFSEANPEAINSLGKRATVGHVFEGSAAHAAGIGLGHVLLKVNGKECRSADEAAHLIRNTPRPLYLDCYAPPKEHLKVSVWEGKHMVKYDTKEKYAPQSKWEWKPKYVVVGGVIANPLQMNMYRSKAEYDTAVKEVQGGETKVSVKVKQFDLYNAHIVLGRNGQPRAVDYLETWHYLVIVPLEGNPIKIAATSPERLVPVHTGIQKALNDAKIQARAVREEEEEYARQHGGYRETQSGNRYYGDDAPVVRSRHYDAYGGNDYYQQQYQQQPAYSSPPPQQISYDQGYGGDYNQGYAQQPQQQQQQQSNSATPWASY